MDKQNLRLENIVIKLRIIHESPFIFVLLHCSLHLILLMRTEQAVSAVLICDIVFNFSRLLGVHLRKICSPEIFSRYLKHFACLLYN